MQVYTGVSVVDLNDTNSHQEWYANGELEVDKVKATGELCENTGVVIKLGNSKKDYGIVKNGKIKKMRIPEAFGVKPKNAEQTLAMNMLLDEKIKLKMITGKEGTGKNFITAACVMELLTNPSYKYNKLILTRTTDEVGKTLGLFPGDAGEKFANHTQSFKYTMNAIAEDDDYVATMMDKGDIDYIPVQLMRGVSFPAGTIVWADEIAGLSPYELRMLGTRLGEDCILVLTGSFEQIDRKYNVKPEDKAKETGMWKLVNSSKIKKSKIAGHIELRKNERSRLSTLVSDVL